jgi:hypothetical protein
VTVLYRSLQKAAERIGADVRVEERNIYNPCRNDEMEVVITRGHRRVAGVFRADSGRVRRLRGLPLLRPTSGRQFLYPGVWHRSITEALAFLLPTDEFTDNGRYAAVIWYADSYGKVAAQVCNPHSPHSRPLADRGVVESLLRHELPGGVFLDWLEDQGFPVAVTAPTYPERTEP